MIVQNKFCTCLLLVLRNMKIGKQGRNVWKFLETLLNRSLRPEMETNMKITITISTENVAFIGENLRPEICRILNDIAGALKLGRNLDEINVIDLNGNKVGEFKIER